MTTYPSVCAAPGAVWPLNSHLMEYPPELTSGAASGAPRETTVDSVIVGVIVAFMGAFSALQLLVFGRRLSPSFADASLYTTASDSSAPGPAQSTSKTFMISS